MSVISKRRVFTSILASSALCAAASAVPAISVPLDPTFGSNGKVLGLHSLVSDVRGLAVQGDGKLVVAAYSENTSSFDFAVARLNSDGSLDTTFDGDGAALTDFFGDTDRAEALALQSDGKIVVAGVSYDSGGGFAVARYNANGSLDTAFSGDGLVRIANVNPELRAVAVQTDGKIVAVGSGVESSTLKFIVLRLNSDGSLDTSFDGDGIAFTAVGPQGAAGNSVLIQTDGKIIAGGSSFEGPSLVRYNTNGTLDTSFDLDGKVIVVSPNSVGGTALQADGKILMTGTTSHATNTDLALYRFNTNGALDSSFGGDGLVTTDTGTGEGLTSAIVQGDGKILVAGAKVIDDLSRFLAARYEADGDVDTSFDDDGYVAGDFEGIAAALALQADGKLVLAGRFDASLVRYILTCGDSTVDAGEQCDDGNTTNGDGCDNNCRTSGCGSGITVPPEECDDTNATNGDGCDNNCTVTGCGNGIQSAGEPCDDGNNVNGDGCDNNCTASACGNDEVAPTEECDDGNLIEADGCDSNCEFSGCGNGVATRGRQCDGTATNGAGCIDECNSGWTSPFGSGVYDVHAFAVSGGNLFAGGIFEAGSGAISNGIAKWDGATWSALGSGVEGEVYAVAVVDDDVYAAGSIGDSIQKWDGTSWSTVGGGADADVLALHAHGGDLYAGGDFGNVGVVPASRIAKWDGANWSALGDGLDGPVFAITSIESDVYVAGGFANAGGMNANNVAKWDGVAWSALGTGAPGTVNALGVWDGDLYAGGYEFVVKWDGVSWTPLGTLSGSDVKAIAVVGDALYIGGAFTSLGGTSVSNIAKWDGNVWLSLGSGASENVAALATNSIDLFVGGAFDNAGGNSAASGVAIWKDLVCGEQCDDGNGTDGDGCDQNCTPSACGNGIAAGAEVCDDGNTSNGDGCDGNCTASVCGNGVASPATGEMCDDANIVNGDGCETNCTITPVVQMVGAGATVTTDPLNNGATPEFPVQTAITTPNGGTVSIAAPSAPVELEDVQVVGVQLQIEAPPATVADPLVIVITVDGSAIPAGVDPTRLDILRDGIPIPGCTGAAGTASPDPCIESRMLLANGDVRITVLTSHASLWTVVVSALNSDEQKCVNGVNGAGFKVAKAQAKVSMACMKAASLGEEVNPQACLTADVKGKVAKAAAKTAGVVTGKCFDAPPFGLTSADIVNAAAQSAQLTLMADVFGDSVNGVFIGDGTPGAACQKAVLRSVVKVFDTNAKLFLKCKKSGMKGTGSLIVSRPDLANCFDLLAADAGSKIGKSVEKLATVLVEKCIGISLPAAFPGSCSTPTAGCFDVRVSCRICRMFNAMDGLSEDCDRFDDGVSNGSCL